MQSLLDSPCLLVGFRETILITDIKWDLKRTWSKQPILEALSPTCTNTKSLAPHTIIEATVPRQVLTAMHA